MQDIFHIENQAIECVTSYKYLGIMLQASGKFTQARKMMYNKALMGMFKIRKDLLNLNPSINTLLHLYEHTIQPIATYGGELWDLANFTEKSKGSHLYNIYKDWEFGVVSLHRQ